MKKILIIISLLLTYALQLKADYRPLRLYQMILKADKIVNGTIIKIEKEYFYIKDSSLGNKIVKVKKFKNWACASRYAEYEIGQHVLLLLKKEKNYYYIMSAGGEGEIPIVQDSVIIKLDCFSIPSEWRDSSFRISKDSLMKYSFVFGNGYSMKVKVSFWELYYTIKELRLRFNSVNKSVFLECKDFTENQFIIYHPKDNGNFFDFVYAGIISDKKRYCQKY